MHALRPLLGHLPRPGLRPTALFAQTRTPPALQGNVAADDEHDGQCPDGATDQEVNADPGRKQRRGDEQAGRRVPQDEAVTRARDPVEVFFVELAQVVTTRPGYKEGRKQWDGPSWSWSRPSTSVPPGARRLLSALRGPSPTVAGRSQRSRPVACGPTAAGSERSDRSRKCGGPTSR